MQRGSTPRARTRSGARWLGSFVPQSRLMPWIVATFAILIAIPLAAQGDPSSSSGRDATNSSRWSGDRGRTVGDVLGPSPESAAGESESSTTGAEPSRLGRITMGDYLRVLGWLVVVVLMAVVSIYALRRVQRPGAERAGRLMEVVSRTALTQKHQLVAVRVGERLLVVGVSPEGVRPISELSDPREVVPFSSGGDFSRALEQQSVEPKDEPAAVGPDESEFAPHRREVRSLRKMVGAWRRPEGRGGRR